MTRRVRPGRGDQDLLRRRCHSEPSYERPREPPRAVPLRVRRRRRATTRWSGAGETRAASHPPRPGWPRWPAAGQPGLGRRPSTLAGFADLRLLPGGPDVRAHGVRAHGVRAHAVRARVAPLPMWASLTAIRDEARLLSRRCSRRAAPTPGPKPRRGLRAPDGPRRPGKALTLPVRRCPPGARPVWTARAPPRSPAAKRGPARVAGRRAAARRPAPARAARPLGERSSRSPAPQSVPRRQPEQAQPGRKPLARAEPSARATVTWLRQVRPV